jgi:hypothetical protein
MEFLDFGALRLTETIENARGIGNRPRDDFAHELV